MAETGFIAQKPRSATGLVLVIAVHGAALTALALSKMEMPHIEYPRIKTYNVPVAPPPPERTEAPPEEPRRSVIDSVPPRIPTPPIADRPVIELTDIPSFPGDTIAGTDPPRRLDSPAPPFEPVRVDARMSRVSELQPPYPSSEQRMGREGSVAIRLRIGADGRVVAAEKVRATSDAFYRATERHALSRWRFSPAMVDGRPVESWKTLTVHFRLDG